MGGNLPLLGTATVDSAWHRDLVARCLSKVHVTRYNIEVLNDLSTGFSNRMTGLSGRVSQGQFSTR